MQISVIVPCYNSMPILRTMIEKTTEELNALGLTEHEFILVNDCSPKPETLPFLKSIADEFPSVKVVDLAKNAGQANAQVAALHYVSGDIILNMDDDMQTHPKNIPALYNKLMEGYDLVLGSYIKKRHAFHRRLMTAMDNRFEEVFLKNRKISVLRVSGSPANISPMKSSNTAIRMLLWRDCSCALPGKSPMSVSSISTAVKDNPAIP